MTIKPLDPYSEVVDNRRRWQPDWYSWLQDLTTVVNTPSSSGGTFLDGGVVNAWEFGAVGDNVTDDTAAIQAAIDYACNNNHSAIFIPKGTYKISSALFLDPPDNMRPDGVTSPPNGTFDSPEHGAFSLTLMGDPSSGNHEGFGTSIRPTYSDFPAIIVGPGQGMGLRDLSIKGPEGFYRGNHPGTDAFTPASAVALTGFGVGSRTFIANIHVENFNRGFRTGWGSDGLNDSNTFIKCTSFNTYIGLEIWGTQNFINSCYDCNFSATRGIVALAGGGCHVFGGNFSTSAAEAAGLTVSSVSALTMIANGNTFRATFTAVVTANGFFPNVYNTFAFMTEHFGVVPCELTNWDDGTDTATFEILITWISTNFGVANLKTGTDIEAELQACTKVFCAETCTPFEGVNITAIGIHIENDLAPTCLIRSRSTFGGSRPNVLSQIFFNTDPSFAGFAETLPTQTDANKARVYISRSHPFIWTRDTDTHISDSSFGLNVPVVIDTTPFHRFTVERCTAVTLWFQRSSLPGSDARDSDAPWCGEYDTFYFRSGINSTEADQYPRRLLQMTPFWHNRPAPWSTPCVSPGDFTTISGTLPAISGLIVPYPLLLGGQIYRKFPAVGANSHFISSHSGYTYGQDLTTTNIPGLSWSYKGQSCNVYMSGAVLLFMRPGLTIGLDNGTDGEQFYSVLGVFAVATDFGADEPFYITVNPLTVGNKTTLYSGTVITQQPYAITAF